MTVISIKRHMENHERELSRALLSAYESAIGSTVRSCSRAVPPGASGLYQILKHLRPRLGGTLTPAEIADIQQEFDGGLLKWEEKAEQISKDNVANVREIMMAVAASASAIARRDSQNTDRFNKVTEELQSIAKIDDLNAMRLSVVRSASEIRTYVDEMKRQGERSIAELQAQISDYQQRDSMDPLTGLANRSAIENRIQNRIEFCSTFCLAVLDLNGFKKINDTYGHAAGDDLLKHFADEIRPIFRATDLVGRWGGDEFAFVIDSTPEDAANSLDRLRQWAFGEYTISDGDQSIPVMVSAAIGMARWDGSESALELFNRADKLMYADKKAASISSGIGHHRDPQIAKAG